MPSKIPAPSPLGSAVEAAVEFFEGLGGCVAIFAGAAAIIHYRSIVMPFWPDGAALFGKALLFTSLVLALLVAGNWFATHARHIQSRISQFAIATLLVLTTAFFVIAGGFAAVKAL